MNFSPNKTDQIATKIGVVVVSKATSLPCKYLNAFKKAKYIIPNCNIPINVTDNTVFKLKFFKNGKNIKVATNNLKNTTNSAGNEANWLLINPKDNEKQIVAMKRYNIIST